MTGNLTYAGDIPNLGTNVGITKSGSSSLTLTGNNIYSGKTRVHAGTLSFNSIGNVSGGSSALGTLTLSPMEPSTSAQAAPREPSSTRVAVMAATV